jgi:GTP-binding protein
MADIPGLIEGAHQGKGLGDRFLQHIERTRVLAYLVPVDHPDPQRSYEGLRAEVASYSVTVAEKPHVVVLTKTDLLPAGAASPTVAAPRAHGVIGISAVAGHGLGDLNEHLWTLIAASRAAAAQPAERQGFP